MGRIYLLSNVDKLRSVNINTFYKYGNRRMTRLVVSEA